MKGLHQAVVELRQGPTRFDVLCQRTATAVAEAPDSVDHMYELLGFLKAGMDRGLFEADTTTSPVTYSLTQKGRDQLVDCEWCGRPWHEGVEPVAGFNGPMVLCKECRERVKF